MKTAGKIIATLITLLAVYLLGYWLLIKKEWAHKLLYDHADPFCNQSRAYYAVNDAYEPIRRLDRFWTFRRYCTGHWGSDTSSDFVTIGPNQECRFRLGEFASEGIADYGSENRRLAMTFQHQDRTYHFVFVLNAGPESLGSSKQAFTGVASIFENHPPPIPVRPPSHLTKQAPSALAP